LWFMSEDVPVHGRLPKNIAEVTRAILRSAQGVPGLQVQLDSTLRLVCWSGVAERCGVQIEIIDTLLGGECLQVALQMPLSARSGRRDPPPTASG
jgi:hypothetical protein